MAKRSKRLHTQQNKDQAGCMWGLIGLLDFRHGRTTRRLLSDRKLVIKDNVASESTSEVNLITDSKESHVSIEDTGESKNSTLDATKTSVKELMEEEMISEQDSTDQTEKASDISLNDLEAIMKEILMIYQTRHNDLDEGQNRNFSFVEEKLSAAIEVFMNEKSSEDHEKTKSSKDLMDTFQMLTSNKELFLKLLQDQNPLLLNQDQESKSKSKSMTRSISLENEPSNRKHKNFFRRRSKSHDVNNPLSSSRIVVLKPNSLENRLKADNNVHSERIISHFSFMEIKKRFKNAMGKEQSKPGCGERSVEASSGWSSPNRDHFYTERFAKRVEKRVSKLSENDDVRSHISKIYFEAKKHLSEMLSNGDDDAELMMERLPRTLGKILSDTEVNEKSQPCVNSSNLDENLKVHDELNLDTFVEGDPCSIIEDSNPEEAIEIEKPQTQEEMEVMDVFCEQCSSSESANDEQHSENVEVLDEERSPEFSTSNSLEENEFSTPMKIKENEFSTEEKLRPSPVSVLEPLFLDDEISPANTTSRYVDVAIKPLCIQFQDQETCSRNCLENQESTFEYIEAVLLASDLNWDEFEKRWLSSLQILDSSLFHEVEIFSNRPSHDQLLLFDSTNEILQEVCDCYLDFIKIRIQSVPKGADLINEIWERIELNQRSNYPLSLDHIVKKDLGISRTWMDLRPYSREIVFEIDDSIFEEIMDDTLLDLIDDYIDYES
ncbi:uncharacterized protein LOC111920239 isoform X1 [Lactuca sativa]|uniref:DUF4378 domain-containing protein n=1 Tax=Lactuca sativa TaxID=4236 RepID=A0A9R1XPN4_LACSA|nr:uncharacterized protein LOC111920239 isoform X1 [Lactuca sativa]KAJ0215027.1 hypothetical protein LSAT_V11C300155450 [Lactuca sativa]